MNLDLMLIFLSFFALANAFLPIDITLYLTPSILTVPLIVRFLALTFLTPVSSTSPTVLPSFVPAFVTTYLKFLSLNLLPTAATSSAFSSVFLSAVFLPH